MKRILVTVMAFVLPTLVMAQAKELKCFVSAKSGEEIQLPLNEMKTPKGYEHLAGQLFQKTVKLNDGSTVGLSFTLRAKGAKTFDFRANSSDFKNTLHITAALDDRNMFQYTNYSNGMAVQCTTDY